MQGARAGILNGTTNRGISYLIFELYSKVARGAGRLLKLLKVMFESEDYCLGAS